MRDFLLSGYFTTFATITLNIGTHRRMEPTEQYKANSRKVTIFRAPSFLAAVQVGLDDYYAMSNKDIGSYWSGKGSKGQGTGLDFEEVDLLLPLVIDYQPGEREFKQQVKEFFSDMRTKVPHKEGVTLEIGLRKSNNDPLSATNLPINPLEYIRYRHALGHPWVAPSRETAEGNQLIEFYVSDPEAIRKSGTSFREMKEKAMEAYLILTREAKDKPTKIDDVLAVMGEDPRGFKTMDEKLDFLEAAANSSDNKKVSDFLEVATDKKIELRGFVSKLVYTSILRTVGQRYLIAETDKILGDSLEEVLLELDDTEKNGQLLTVFKSQLQEKMKANITRIKKPINK